VAQFRRLFSLIWKECRSWDATISEEQQQNIDELQDYLYDQPTLTIPRYLGTSAAGQSTVHVFADANPVSLGVVMYGSAEGSSDLQLLFAKSVLKGQRSVAELELDALVLASQLILKHLDPSDHRIVLWTDSQLNFHRLSVHTVNSLKFRQANKVIGIRHRLKSFQSSVRHISGKSNPADWLTKFKTEKFEWSRWIRLPVPEEYYDSELHHMLVQQVLLQQLDPELFQVIIKDLEEIDDLTILRQRYGLNKLIQAAQQKSWGPEIRTLMSGKPLTRKSSLGNFQYEIINDLLHTRLRTDSRTTRIMIPADSPLLRLLWSHDHRKNGHSGVNTLRARYLSVYYTRGVKQLFSRWTYLCAYCAYHHRRPTNPSFAPLQESRVLAPTRAFSHIGFDFAGPMRTTDGDRYILLANCFHTRAVLLFLLTEQTSHGIHCVLRRIVSRFGEPYSVYSDNASVFVKTDKVIKKLYKDLKILQDQLKWRFSFPGDPQSNGITEVMIGMVKKKLNGLAFPRMYTALELDTYLAEVEMVINNRPLFIHNHEVITPNHGIYGHSRHPMLQPIETVGEANSEHLHVQIRKKVHSFWNAWYSEYRDNLRHIQVGRQLPALQVGDKVLYMKGEISRTGQYPMGTVIHIYPGQDGNVRLVDLKMETGVVIHKRSIRQLIHFSSQGPEVVAD